MITTKNNINRSTWITASVLGSIIAISGMHYGFFEVLQGNVASEYNIIHAIGPNEQNWSNSSEVFTLIPNYLVTGILSIITSTIIVIWSLRYLHSPYGPSIFIILYIFLTLTGGGIVHILFFIPVWLYSMRIRRSLSWRGKQPSGFLSSTLSAAWIPLLSFTAITFIAALEISMFGYPNASEKSITTTLIILLLTSLVTLNITFFAAITRDISKNMAIA